MTRDEALSALLDYALKRELIAPEERIWAANQLLEVLKLDGWQDPGEPAAGQPLDRILAVLLDDAAGRGLPDTDTAARRDALDTALMGRLTPRPAQVRERFRALYRTGPRQATDWFYRFSGDTNYIRRDRIARDLKWQTDTDYGPLEITVNLSKPEKDPRDIAAAARAVPSAYPPCALCRENEGYAGRTDHPARQNHRVIPLTLGGETWYLQYSPYVYFNEHCICLSGVHRPMAIDRACLARLLEFVTLFPHYFIGSNADLPIVGGSILSHDHFQGGRHAFPMERAPVERQVQLRCTPDVRAGIVRWPMSVLRLTGRDAEALLNAGEQVTAAWRTYDDPALGILSHSGDTPHNTVTPIARRRGADYELDLVLRNNRTTAEHPLGLFHPHAGLHHIKRENIGLIEVMGLAVLPARLQPELAAVSRGLLSGADLRADPLTTSHADWAETFRTLVTPDNAAAEVRRQTGLVFARVLADAGVFKRDAAGQDGFLRFLAGL